MKELKCCGLSTHAKLISGGGVANGRDAGEYNVTRLVYLSQTESVEKDENVFFLFYYFNVTLKVVAFSVFFFKTVNTQHRQGSCLLEH